jgi:hypothetical protein
MAFAHCLLFSYASMKPSSRASCVSLTKDDKPKFNAVIAFFTHICQLLGDMGRKKEGMTLLVNHVMTR